MDMELEPLVGGSIELGDTTYLTESEESDDDGDGDASFSADFKRLSSGGGRHSSPAPSLRSLPPPPPRRAPIKLPEFWQEDPETWFDAAEAQFRRGGVTDSRAKADYLLTALPAALIRSIRDILRDPRADDTTLYHRLKERLLRRFAPSKWQLAYQLIDHPGIGDLRPSQLLDNMLSLLPPGEPPGLLFQALFLRRLSAEIRDHLAAGSFSSVRDMAAMADQLWDARQQAGSGSINAVGGRKGDRRRSPAGQRRRDSTPHPDGLCYYHAKYADRAHKCRPPCTWSGNELAAGGN